MKKVLMGVGAAVIVILLLLQTKFNIFGQVYDEGYAVSGDEVRQMLSVNPDDGIEITRAPMYRFNTLDYIYSRGNSYYMGEGKKTEIDLGFPMLINDGSGVLFLDENSTLFDEDYETARTYEQLRVVDGYAYNADGTQADAAYYYFGGLANGFFVNFDYVTYIDKDEQRVIPKNSFICFKENYLAYGVFEEESLVYRCCTNIREWSLVKVGDQKINYHDLLVALGVISDKKNNENKPQTEGTGDEKELEEDWGDEFNNLVDTLGESTGSEEQAVGQTEKEGDAEKPVPVQPDRPQRPKKPAAEKPEAPQRPPKPAPVVPSPRPKPTGGVPTTNPNVSIGVRPDSMRPDKIKQEDDSDTVIEYVKPTVTTSEVIKGVYRLRIPVTVNDPAGRIHPKKRVQFEFYEIQPDGSEKFVYRTYTGSTGIVTGGGGSIKPGTKYRIKGYFTYFDGKDKETVEQLMDTIAETKPFSSLGTLTLKNSTNGIEIPYYYDNHLEIPYLIFDPETSDEEAIYGIAAAKGMQIGITGTGVSYGVNSDSDLNSNDIRIIKNGSTITWVTPSVLKANGTYDYHIKIEDYFGAELTLTNPDGSFETCKARPQATIEIVKNEIKDIEAKLTLWDPDDSAITSIGSTTDYDIYFVVMEQDHSVTNPLTKEECDQYLADGTNNHDIGYLKKLTPAEYLNGGKISVDETYVMEHLKLARKYRTYVFMDFNLNNGRGDVRFEQVCNMNFTSASLDSLGRVHINVATADISAHTADIIFTLNTERTNPDLSKLISDVSFQVIRGPGEEPVTDVDYQLGKEGTPSALENFKNGIGIQLPPEYFGIKDGTKPLKSKCEYYVDSKVFATYEGEVYELKVEINGGKFKTLKEPTQVLIKDMLLAAGTLRFSVKIDDPDEAIIGNSGHKVIMNVYQNNGMFVTAMRLDKNTEDYIPVELNNVPNRLILRFVAAEYNEGYTNLTYEANKIIKEVAVNQTVDLSGTIKLKDLYLESGSTTKMKATTIVTIEDREHTMLSTPYHIKVERDGQDISEQYALEYNVEAGDYSRTTIKREEVFHGLDKGDHTYKLTLYVVINNQLLILDTLEFTTEEEIINISSVNEFIWGTYHFPTAKFAVTTDLLEAPPEEPGPGATEEEKQAYLEAMDAYDPYLKSNTKFNCPYHTDLASEKGTNGKAMSRHLDTFKGKIDFQGYKLKYAVLNSGASIFTRLDSSAEIYNMVLEVQNRVTTTWDGVICQTNYGHIHDVVLRYTGGNLVNTRYYGMACYLNAASGIIENFIVSNEPEGSLFPFTAYARCGLLVDNNFGQVRNGYAYGDKIYADVASPAYANMEVGGIIAIQSGTGRTSNVYSLVDILVADKEKSSNGATLEYNYGSVIGGSSNGRLENAYGIGQSVCAKKDGSYTIDYTLGPVGGGNANARFKNVYYWFDTTPSYAKGKYDGAKSKYQKLIGLETLYDYSWQGKLLGSQFDTAPVEVGYYPHLICSSELPSQPYIEMPARSKSNPVELMSGSLIDYLDDGDRARILFRFSNVKNYDILSVDIENLDCELDPQTVHSEDGYTTIEGIVSNPKMFLSVYEVNSVNYSNKGKVSTATFAPKPMLFVDFYKKIYNTQDWYDYVVRKPNENARLMNDIDFTGITDQSKIRVTSAYTGKLIGGRDATKKGFALCNITLQTKTGNDRARVFEKLDYSGEINNLVIRNLTLTNVATTAKDSAFVYDDYGNISNVHIEGMNVTNYGYVGGLVSIQRETTLIQNSSVSNMTVNYKEQYNVVDEGRVGGISAYVGSGYIENCFVRNIQIDAQDIGDCGGVGALVGRMASGMINGAYTTGHIEVNGINVGGLVGYFEAANYGGSILNVLSKCDVIASQEMVGGIVGASKNTEILNGTTGFSGVALGNVNCKNPMATGVSYTVGLLLDSKIYLYGSRTQLMNGLPFVEGSDENTDDNHMLTLEQLKDPKTYREKVRMAADCFNYDMVVDNLLPNLYYMGTTIPLPNQEEDLLLTGKKDVNNIIAVQNVFVNDTLEFMIDIQRPDNCVVKDVVINKLNYTYLQADSSSVDYRRLFLKRAVENDQSYWLDSYDLVGISYDLMADDGVTVLESGYCDYSQEPIVVPITLYAEIAGLEDWAAFFSASKNYGNYQNYKVIKDISFTSGTFIRNVKAGRLIGANPDHADKSATLSDINIGTSAKAVKENLFVCLSAEMSKINFENVKIYFTDRQKSGIIGTSSANIHDVNFDTITVNNSTNGRDNTGLIGKQNGGSLQNLTLSNIYIGTEKETYQNYTGGLAGSCYYNTKLKDITATNVNVEGGAYTGGLVGYTNRACFEDIAATDFKVSTTPKCVDSKNKVLHTPHYVGGIVGSYNVGYSGTKGPWFWNVSLTGTPTYDPVTGYVTGSTTTITNNMYNGTANYVGGIAGYSNCGQTGYKGDGTNAIQRTAANKRPITVSGVVVRSGGEYVGGAYGYCRYTGNVNVTDALVTNYKSGSDTPISNAKKYRYGGVTGYAIDNCTWLEAVNTKVQVKNVEYVGGVVGQSYSGSCSNFFATHCYIDAIETAGNTCQRVGGVCGWAQNGFYNSIAENTVVDAPDYGYVGGVVGFAQTTCTGLVYYAEPVNMTNTPCSKPTYFVRGNNYVGGVEGYRNTAVLSRASSNANVIATGNYAGGLVGGYNNAYTSTTIDNKTSISYSTVGLSYNMFSGSVFANSFAGGAMGANTMAITASVHDNLKALGGRTKDVDSTAKTASGTNYEYAYTTYNLIMADTVAAKDGKANVFSGVTDGFEGNVNLWNASASYKYLAKKYHARYTFFWQGMKVGKKTDWNTADLTPVKPTSLSGHTEVYYMMDSANPDHWKYFMWDEKASGVNSRFGFNESTSYNANVRLITTDDLKKIQMYNALGFRDKNMAANSMKNHYTRLLFGDAIGTADEWKAIGDAAAYKIPGAYYLPHVRMNDKSNAIKEDMTTRQSEHRLDLPMPGPVMPPRIPAAYTPEEADTDNYDAPSMGGSVIAYPVAVDSINIEFAPQYIGSGESFTVYYGGRESFGSPIESRVYTFDYDYRENVKVVLSDGDSFTFNANVLRNPVMTHGSEYYYISEEGVVHGTTASAVNTLTGKYIHLNKGMALTNKGEVVDIASGNIVRTVKGMEASETLKSLQSFKTGDVLVRTYGMYSDFVNADGSVVSRDTQMLASVNGATGSVAGMISNVKDSVILHRANDNNYLIALGMDGRIANLYGELEGDFVLPEDFANRGIVHISNNLNTSVPYMLVEYSNGGMVGFNYTNGNYLFNHFIAQEVSILDYARDYFDGDKPELTPMGSSYPGNQLIIEQAGTPERLHEMIEGTASPEGGNANNQKDEEKVNGLEPGEKTDDPIGVQGIPGIDSGDMGNDNSDQEEGQGSDSTDIGIEQQAGGSAVVSGENSSVEGITGTNGAGLGNGDALGNGNAPAEEGSGQALEEGGQESDSGLVGDSFKDKDKQENADQNVVAQGSQTDSDTSHGPKDIKDSDDEDEASDAASDAEEEAEEPEGEKVSFVDITNQAGQEEKNDAEANEDSASQSEELTVQNANFGNLLTVYNVVTGTYEIVDMSRYMSEPNYISENHLLQIKDFTEVIDTGLAQGEKEGVNLNGLLLYILVAVVILAGVAFTMEFRQKKKRK